MTSSSNTTFVPTSIRHICGQPNVISQISVALDAAMEARIRDAKEAVAIIKNELLADLPKIQRSGKVLVDGLSVEVVEPALTE